MHSYPDILQQKTDRLMIAYLAVTAALSIARTPDWPWRVAVHGAAIAVVIWLASHRGPLPATLRFVRDWYPAISFPLLYKEVETLARAVGNWGLTGYVRQWEEGLWSGQPSLWMSERLPSIFLSEYLHFMYFAYILLLPAVGGWWYFSKQRPAFHELLFLLTATYLLNYLFYILLPVDSPFYLAPRLEEPLSDQFFYNLVHFFSARGGARGGAFPSSHVAVSTVVWLAAWRWQPRLALLITPVVLGVYAATVYGRFHYTLDVFAGWIVALAVVGMHRRTASASRESQILSRPL